MSDSPLIQHTMCIDLPGEPVQCWAGTDVTILLRKHRDVIFDISMKKGASYTVEATADWLYDVKQKKRVQKGQFNDGEPYHIWISRDFKGQILLKSNGVILQRYSMARLDLHGESSDPKVKPAPIILTLGSQPSTASTNSSSSPKTSATFTGNIFTQRATLVCRNTDSTTSETAWWNQMIPLKLGQPGLPAHTTAASIPATVQSHAGEHGIVHIFEVEIASAPAEVLQALSSGGEDTAIDANHVATRNWLIGQLAGGAAYVKDNLNELKDLWNRSFRLFKVAHPKAGVLTYLAFNGDRGSRKTVTSITYGAKNTKILAMTAGAGTLESVTAATWEASKGAFKEAGGVALLFTITLDTAEWYRDYENVDSHGHRKRDLSDLFAKVGVDLIAAGLTAAMSVSLVGLATTILLSTAVITTAPVWAVAAATIGTVVVIGYLINLADNHWHITDWVAAKLRNTGKYLEDHYPKDYEGYPTMFMP